MRIEFAKHLPISSPHVIFATPRDVSPHISKEETEAQKGEVACPRSHGIGANCTWDSASRALPKHSWLSTLNRH